jgi:hypothetical protein
MARTLGLSWQTEKDAQPNGTLPGSALIFELWRDQANGALSVRTHFQSQTLDQMRRMTPMTLRSPPVRVSLSPAGCGADSPCEWGRFRTAIESAIDPTFVGPP